MRIVGAPAAKGSGKNCRSLESALDPAQELREAAGDAGGRDRPARPSRDHGDSGELDLESVLDDVDARGRDQGRGVDAALHGGEQLRGRAAAIFVSKKIRRGPTAGGVRKDGRTPWPVEGTPGAARRAQVAQAADQLPLLHEEDPAAGHALAVEGRVGGGVVGDAASRRRERSPRDPARRALGGEDRSDPREQRRADRGIEQPLARGTEEPLARPAEASRRRRAGARAPRRSGASRLRNGIRTSHGALAAPRRWPSRRRRSRFASARRRGRRRCGRARRAFRSARPDA